MRIGVSWQRGTLHVDAELTESLSDLINRIAVTIKVHPRQITLFNDCLRQQKLPWGTLASCGLTGKQVIFMKVDGTLPPTPPLTELPARPPSAPPVSARNYLGPNETELTSEMGRFQEMWGRRAISVGFMEHRDSFKAHIERQPESSCFAIRVGEEALKRFQSLALHEEFRWHRLTFLFGRVTRLTGKITVHVACEPPQTNFPDRVEVSATPDLDTACSLARQFGMECVGMAVSHQPDAKYPMTSYMVQLAAHYQNRFGEYFTTLVVSPTGHNDVSIEAFQVSDETLRLEREAWIVPGPKPTELNFRDEVFVCGCRKKTADVNLCLCAVRVRLTHSKFPNHNFPSPSQSPTLLDLKMHLRDNEFCPNWYQLFDFNLLLFLQTKGIFSASEIEGEIIPNLLAQEDIPQPLMAKIEHRLEPVAQESRGRR
jgi:hypothetical protein